MPPAIYALALATFAVGTQTYVFVGLLSELASDLGVSVAVAGQLSTVFAITSAVAAPVVVNAVARHERRRVLIVALLSIGLINIGMASLPSFATLVGARVVLAVCSSLIIPMAGAIAAAMVPPDRQGRALGLILSGLTLALVVGVPIGSVIGSTFGWRSTFVFAGAMALLAIPPVGWLVPASRGVQRASLSNFTVLTRPVIALGLLLSAISFVAAYPVFAYIGPLIGTVAAIEGRAIGLIQAFAGVGAVAGIVIGGRMADQRAFGANTRQLFGALVPIQASYTLWFLLPGSGGTWMALPLTASLFGASVVLFALGPVIEKALVRAEPEHSALTLAMNTSVIYAGQGIGAALGGIIIGWHGFASLGYVGGVVAAVGLVVAVLARVAEGRPLQP